MPHFRFAAWATAALYIVAMFVVCLWTLLLTLILVPTVALKTVWDKAFEAIRVRVANHRSAVSR